MFAVLFFVSLCVVGSTAAGKKKWDYVTDEYGVDAWPKNFPVCNGSSQSPIDIINPTYSNLGDIKFTNYERENVQITAENNGYTYVATFNSFTEATTPTISEGGLPGEYKLAQFHFHWGSNHTLGSEHYVNGEDFPAELHLVHLNAKYANVSEGRKYPDGLAVLGVLFKEGAHNENYNFLNLTTNNITYKGMNTTLTLSTTLMGLLPSNKSFYRYNGSLTTPGCQEVVTWTVFSHYVYASADQLNALRHMYYTDFKNNTQKLVNNYRTTQPLNDRTVLAYFVPTTAPTTAPPIILTTNGTDTVTTTDSAYGVSENSFLFLASLCLVLLSFLEI